MCRAFRLCACGGPTGQQWAGSPCCPHFLVAQAQVPMRWMAGCVLHAGEDGGHSPSEVRVFTNRDDLDFGAVADLPPTQKWDLGENLRGQIELPTQARRLRSVTRAFSTCCTLSPRPASRPGCILRLRQCTAVQLSGCFASGTAAAISDGASSLPRKHHWLPRRAIMLCGLWDAAAGSTAVVHSHKLLV